MDEGDRSPGTTSHSERRVTGWTNDYVQDGFEIDGSQDRAHLLSLGTRYAIARVLYTFLGETYLRLARSDRSVYPIIRRLGSTVNRRRIAEQRIAENEYLLSMVQNSDRSGIGSREWLLGGALLGGSILVIVGGGSLLFAFAIGVFMPSALHDPAIVVIVMLFTSGVGIMLLVGFLLNRTHPCRTDR